LHYTTVYFNLVRIPVIVMASDPSLLVFLFLLLKIYGFRIRRIRTGMFLGSPGFGSVSQRYDANPDSPIIKQKLLEKP
jgi:hypothetical protein